MLSNSFTTSVNFPTSSSSIAAAISYPPGLKKKSVLHLTNVWFTCDAEGSSKKSKYSTCQLEFNMKFQN